MVGTQGFEGFYADALASPATRLMGLDLVIALSLVLLWMRRDSRRSGTPFVPYLVATLAFGSAGPLLYLLHRGAERRSRRLKRGRGPRCPAPSPDGAPGA